MTTDENATSPSGYVLVASDAPALIHSRETEPDAKGRFATLCGDDCTSWSRVLKSTMAVLSLDGLCLFCRAEEAERHGE